MPSEKSSGQTSHTFQTELTRSVSLDYLLFLPKAYNTQTDPWPLVFIDESQRLVDRLESLEGNVKFTVYPEAKHYSSHVIWCPRRAFVVEWKSQRNAMYVHISKG